MNRKEFLKKAAVASLGAPILMCAVAAPKAWAITSTFSLNVAECNGCLTCLAELVDPLLKEDSGNGKVKWNIEYGSSITQHGDESWMAGISPDHFDNLMDAANACHVNAIKEVG